MVKKNLYAKVFRQFIILEEKLYLQEKYWMEIYQNVKNSGAGKIAHWLRTLPAAPEDVGSILNTHMAAHNQFQ